MKKLLYTLLLSPLFFILSCEDEECSNPELGYDCDGNFIEYVIGMQAEGGIVFYVDETGQHGLIAAMEDLPGRYK